jgi:hypothetical protein
MLGGTFKRPERCDVGELLVPVLLVVRVMGRLVQKELPVAPFESWDH